MDSLWGPRVVDPLRGPTLVHHSWGGHVGNPWDTPEFPCWANTLGEPPLENALCGSALGNPLPGTLCENPPC
jgi:hypothetical protein